MSGNMEDKDRQKTKPRFTFAGSMRPTFLSLLLSSLVFSAPAQTELTRLDSTLSSTYRPDRPGAAVAVIKGGRLIFKKGYGVSDLASKNSITTATNFNIGSMTKQFTAYGILMLRAKGSLSLSDPISKYFPHFVPHIANSVTIRHLLTHSSGIVNHYPYVNTTPFREFRDDGVLEAVQNIDSSYFPPGSRYRYSNTGFCLLSQIIEKVSGTSYPAFIAENIYAPLGMTRSGVIHHDFTIADRAIGYDCSGDTCTRDDANESFFFSTMGDGGIYTSMDDYLKWIGPIMQKKGAGESLIEEARAPQFPIDSARHVSYGFGWFVAGSGTNQMVYHTGSNGGFRAIVVTKPSEGYAVVILSNRTGVDLEDLARAISALFGVDDSAYVKLDSLI